MPSKRARHEDVLAEESTRRVRALLADPVFLVSQRGACLRLLQALRGPLEELRAGLARLGEPHLVQQTVEAQHRAHNVRLALLNDLDGRLRLDLSPEDEDALAHLPATDPRSAA